LFKDLKSGSFKQIYIYIYANIQEYLAKSELLLEPLIYKFSYKSLFVNLTTTTGVCIFEFKNLTRMQHDLS